MKMLSAGGHVPTQTLAPASAIAFAIANPKPASSATPATNARRPSRSIGSMRGSLAGAGGVFTFHERALIQVSVRLRMTRRVALCYDEPEGRGMWTRKKAGG